MLTDTRHRRVASAFFSFFALGVGCLAVQLDASDSTVAFGFFWLLFGFFAFAVVFCLTSPRSVEIDAHGITVKRTRFGLFHREWRMEEEELKQLCHVVAVGSESGVAGGGGTSGVPLAVSSSDSRHYLVAVSQGGTMIPLCWGEYREYVLKAIAFARDVGLCRHTATYVTARPWSVLGGGDGGGDSGDGDGGDGD